MAVLDCKPRSASVRAVSDCSLLMLKNDKLQSLSAAEESAYSKIKSNLSCEMSEHLRQTNEMTVRSLRMQLAEEKSMTLANLLTPAAGQYGEIRKCDFNRLCAPGFGRLKPEIKIIRETIT